MKSKFAVEKKSIRDPTDDNKITYKNLKKIAVNLAQSDALGERELEYAINQGFLLNTDARTVAALINKMQGLDLKKSYKIGLKKIISQYGDNLSDLTKEVKSFTKNKISLEPVKGLFSGFKKN